MKKENKTKFDNAKYLSERDNINGFDYIYFIQQKQKHDSGYNLINIYGEKNNNIYLLSARSDVIDFNKVISSFEWFCSIDIPDYNIIRLFTRDNRKFYYEFLHCSSFNINIM